MSADSKLTGVLLSGTFAARPAANTVAGGTLYSDTTNNILYQSDGSSWSTWATLGGAPAFVQLADTTLGADAANIDFTSISGSYAHLRVVIYARTDRAGNDDNVGFRLNNDSGANYASAKVYESGGTANGAAGSGNTFGEIGFCPAASASANEFSAMELLIPHYANSTNKKTTAAFGGYIRSSASSSITGQATSFWNNTAAITRVTILPVGGGANLKSGTRATLYGMK